MTKAEDLKATGRDMLRLRVTTMKGKYACEVSRGAFNKLFQSIKGVQIKF